MRPLFSYSKMLCARKDCFRRFGHVFSLPILFGSPLGALASHVSLAEGQVLDFGAGPQSLRGFINSRFPLFEYRSLDADSKYVCDWERIEDIPAEITFSLICADQVLEHMPLEDSLQIVAALSEKLAPGGLFYASVPNTSHPNRFRGDIDHCTYVNYTDLYYICSSAGLDIAGIFRYSKRHPQGWFERFIAQKIQDIYRMDWRTPSASSLKNPPSLRH